jgi:hypothetical protein
MLNKTASSRRTFFSHARIALKYGLISLDIKPGDEVLIPDFICEVVLHPLDDLGIKPCYFPLNSDLSPDWGELEKLVNDKTKALLMVHYFGQPQDISKFRFFCERHFLALIEDNAHGYGAEYEGQLLGTFGDIGITSPRKFHDIISGGILFQNNDGLLTPQIDHIKDFPTKLNQKLFKFFSEKFPRLKRYLKRKIQSRPFYEDPLLFREPKIEDFRIDKLSMSNFNAINWKQMAEIKRERYFQWESFLKHKDLVPVFETMNETSAPQCFPAYASDVKSAKKWFDWGWENGYHVYSWPALPEEVILAKGSALQKWENLICFSTAQELNLDRQSNTVA